MRSLRIWVAVAVFSSAVAAVTAQSNALVDALLEQENTRVDYAAYIALTAGGIVPETASPEEALAAAKSRNWIASSRASDAPIRLDEFSALVMRSLGLKGGVLYSIFPGPRYAYREFSYKGIINATGGPRRHIPGDEALRILRVAMAVKGGQ